MDGLAVPTSASLASLLIHGLALMASLVLAPCSAPMASPALFASASTRLWFRPGFGIVGVARSDNGVSIYCVTFRPRPLHRWRHRLARDICIDCVAVTEHGFSIDGVTGFDFNFNIDDVTGATQGFGIEGFVG